MKENDVAVTDEVVELAAQAYNDAIKTDAFGDVGDDQHCDAMQAALEAALPLLAPQPSLPVCPNCEGEHFTCGSCGIVLDATAAPDVQVGYEAVYEVIRERRPGLPGPVEVNALIWSGVHAFINAMGINPKVTLQLDDQQVASAAAQPVVDREALCALLRATRVTVNDEWHPTETSAGQIADAVLALLNTHRTN